MALLKQRIAQWNGRSKHEITEIYEEFELSPQFVSKLCLCLEEQKLQSGASWLLKHSLERRFRQYKQNCKQLKASLKDIESSFRQQSLLAEDRQFVYSQLEHFEDWQVKLHFLQTLPYLLMDENCRMPLERFLRSSLTDTNKMVRAWAYNGFYLLSCEFEQYAKEVDQYLAMGLRDEPACVQSRIRNINKLR